MEILCQDGEVSRSVFSFQELHFNQSTCHYSNSSHLPDFQFCFTSCMNVQVCTILVGCHDRAFDVPSWLKPEINPKTMRAFQPTNDTHEKHEKTVAGLAWSAWSPLTWPSWLTWLRFPWRLQGPPGTGDLDFRFPLLQNCRCNPRVFQSAKSFGLLFSSSAARAPSPSSISWKNRMQNNDLGLVLIRRSRIFFTQSMIQLLFLYLSYSFYGSASAFQSPRCVFHQSPWLSHGGQARASWRVFMNATLSRTLPSPKTAMPVMVALVTAAVCSALKETQNRTCIAAWLYHTLTALSGAPKMIRVVLTICFIALLTKKSSNPISEMRQCQNTPQLRKVTTWNGEWTDEAAETSQHSKILKVQFYSQIYNIHTAWSVQRME